MKVPKGLISAIACIVISFIAAISGDSSTCLILVGLANVCMSGE